MKNRIITSHLLAACVSLAITCPSHAEQVVNLIENPGFEQQLQDWQVHRIDKDHQLSEVVEDDPHTGSFSLKVTDTSTEHGSSASSREEIPAQPGETFTLSLWCKVIEGKARQMAVYLLFYDEADSLLTKNDAGKHDDAFMLYLPEKSDEWQQIALDTTAPPNTSYAKVWIHSFGSGKITTYIDDLVLKLNTDSQL